MYPLKHRQLKLHMLLGRLVLLISRLVLPNAFLLSTLLLSTLSFLLHVLILRGSAGLVHRSIFFSVLYSRSGSSSDSSSLFDSILLLLPGSSRLTCCCDCCFNSLAFCCNGSFKRVLLCFWLVLRLLFCLLSLLCVLSGFLLGLNCRPLFCCNRCVQRVLLRFVSPSCVHLKSALTFLLFILVTVGRFDFTRSGPRRRSQPPS
jgi:hypothetical protein